LVGRRLCQVHQFRLYRLFLPAQIGHALAQLFQRHQALLICRHQSIDVLLNPDLFALQAFSALA
jgi:hypothetical protein